MVIVLVAFLDVLFFSDLLSVHVMCAFFFDQAILAIVLVLLMFQKTKRAVNAHSCWSRFGCCCRC